MHLDFSGLLGQAWSIFKEKWGKILGFFFVFFLIEMLAQWPISMADSAGASEAFLAILNIALWFFDVFISAGFVSAVLKISRQQDFAIADIFSKAEVFWRYLGGSLLFGLIVVAGTVFLIVPGIYLALTYWPIYYLIIDKGMSICEAFKAAKQMTMGTKWTMFLFQLMMLALIILGAIPLGLGLIIVIPVMTIASTLIYNKLVERLTV